MNVIELQTRGGGMLTGPVGGHVGHGNTAPTVALLGMTKGRDNRNTGPGSDTRKNPVCGDRCSKLMTVVKVTINGLVA